MADRFQSTLDAMETPPKVFIMYLHNTPAIDMTGIHALEAFRAPVRKAAASSCRRRNCPRSKGSNRAVGEENDLPVSLDEALARRRDPEGKRSEVRLLEWNWERQRRAFLEKGFLPPFKSVRLPSPKAFRVY